MIDDLEKSGRRIIVMGFLLAALPFLHQFGYLVLFVGISVHCSSDETIWSKLKWIIVPILLLTALYLFQNR